MAGTTSNTVNKLQPSDGTILGTYHAGIGPSELAFDGVHIWVTDFSSNPTITVLWASDGEPRPRSSWTARRDDILFEVQLRG